MTRHEANPPKPEASLELESDQGPESYPETLDVSPSQSEAALQRVRTRPKPRIPGYRIEEAIGRGATGVVYRATQLAVERPVAVKILHPELVGTKRAVRRLQREARTAARLAHPSIISAIDMGEQDGQWWYAMELVEGIPLSERLRQGQLSEREALRVFTPLCEALQHACEAGVVHRDIKPANILIDERGRARLVDLGLAFAEDDPMMTKGGGTLGTPHYISPEQARDPATADSRSDLWSLGATLFHSLCGRPPFEGESVAEILSGVLYERIPDPRKLNPHLSRGMTLVLRKCLNHDPRNRYQEPAELLRDLERLRERRAPRVRPGSLDPVQGQRSLIVLTGIVVAAALAVVAMTWVLVSRPWQDVGPAPVDLGGPRAYPRIERVVHSFEHERALAKPTLDALAALRLDYSTQESAARQRIDDAEVSVLESLTDRLDSLMEIADGRWMELLQERRFSEVERLFGAQFEEDLFSLTGFSRIDELPDLDRGRVMAWRAPLLGRVREARRVALERAKECIEAYLLGAGVGFGAELDELKASGRWRDAQAIFQTRTDATWCQMAGCEVNGLDPTTLMVDVRSSIRRRSEDLRRDWQELDRRLLEDLKRESAELSERLKEGQVTRAGDLLRKAFEQRLLHLPLDREQLPRSLAGWPSTALPAFEGEVRRLEAEERELVADLAEVRLAGLIDEAEGLSSRREYSRCRDMWEGELKRLEGSSSSGFALDDVTSRVRERLREANLLVALLRRAADGVARRYEKGGEHSLWLGSLRIRGRLDLLAGTDPLTDGFRMVDVGSSKVTKRFHLVPLPGSETVATVDLLDFAGLLAVELTNEEQLTKALFYYHEGDSYEEARQSLPAGMAINDELVSDLRDRIRAKSATLREQQAEAKLRFDSALLLLNRAKGEPDADYARLLEELQRLRTEHAEQIDAEAEAELDRLEAMFQGCRQADQAQTYQPHEDPVDLGLSRKRLRWLFSSSDLGGWSLGRFVRQSTGVELDLPLSLQEMAAPDLALSHSLGPPLDLRREVVLTWVLERSEDASPTNTLVIELPGFSVYYRTAKRPRFWIDDRPLPEGLLAFDAEGEGWEAPAWPEDDTFELSVKFDVADGRCRVFLDGELLVAQRTVFPRLRPSSEKELRVGLTAAQPLLVHECRLEGRF